MVFCGPYSRTYPMLGRGGMLRNRVKQFESDIDEPQPQESRDLGWLDLDVVLCMGAT